MSRVLTCLIALWLLFFSIWALERTKADGLQMDLPIGPPRPDIHIPKPNLPEPPHYEEDDFDPQLFDEEVESEGDSIIYVLDISGSMRGGYMSYTGLDGETTSGSRLDRAKVELIRSLMSLTEDFKFNVIAYDCAIQKWENRTRRATPRNKSRATAWIQALEPAGATGTGPATALALQDKHNFLVILLSDGAPNCIGDSWCDIEAHRTMIKNANTHGARIHTFGIDAYGSFEDFLRNVASDNGGCYYPVN